MKKHRVEHFNLKSKEGLIKFKELTSKDTLTYIVNKQQDVNKLSNKFLKRLNGVIHESFKNIRISDNHNDDYIMKLFEKRRLLNPKQDKRSKVDLERVEVELAEKCAEANYEKIKDELKDMESDSGGLNIGRL